MKGFPKAFALCLLIFSTHSLASSDVSFSGKGIITTTEGHMFPNCRTVGFKSSDTGAYSSFRIKHEPNSDISSVVLTALASGKEVNIAYIEDETSRCGIQPMIRYITIFK